MSEKDMKKLREHGWYLTEKGYSIVSDSGNITDIQKIIKRAAECDLKEIGSGEGDVYEGIGVILQIQKLRNVSAPKSNEESRGAPRMLKFSLSDGKNNYQAVEIENIPSVSLNTPPGTKFLIKGVIVVSHGVILLKPSNIGQVLSGKVANLVEKWELNKKLASHSRIRSIEEGGPPPWIPFGKKIVKVCDQGKNFKALGDKEKSTKENAEFEAQRKDAIAEAAKQGSKKVFGGGNKQLLDHSVQKIVDQGFSIEQAEYALKANRNNVDRALKSLRRTENKTNAKETRGKRNEKKSEEVSAKPSSGKLSLFDFLEDKLPVQVETAETNSSKPTDSHNKDKFDNSSERHSKGYNNQKDKNSRNPKGSRGYQVPPRHLEENKPHKSSNSNVNNYQQHGQYQKNNSQKNKPPRFQHNQENVQNYYQQESTSNYNKFPQVSEFRNTNSTHYNHQPQPQVPMAVQEYSYNVYKQNPQDFQAKAISNIRNHNMVPDQIHNRQTYDPRFAGHGHTVDYNQKLYQPQPVDRMYKNQTNPYYPVPDENQDSIKNSYFNNSFSENNGNSWIWRVGDKCMAKYWEDNAYYNAEVTATSNTTCVVQFKDFNNYEEVLQADCIPLFETPPDKRFNQDGRRMDYRNSKPPRFEQIHNINYGTESHRGGGSGMNGRNRKRGQHRTAQPIYQPPAQRNNTFSN